MTAQAQALASLPVVLRSFESQARADEFARRFVARVCHVSQAYSGLRDLPRWSALYARLLDIAAPDGPLGIDQRMQLVSALNIIATELEHTNVHIFRARFRYWRALLDDRYIPDSLARRLLRLAQASAYDGDRELICELVNERHDVDECEHCGGSFIGEDLREVVSGNQACDDCRAASYVFSEYQDAWIPADEARRVRLANGNHDYAEADHPEFYFHDELGDWVHEDYEPPRQNVIRSYHSSKSHFAVQPSEWTNQHGGRYLGVELEVEAHRVDAEDAAERIHETINGGQYGARVFFEHDGSLNSGFEIITQPVGLPAVRELFGELLQPDLVRGLRSHRTTTCGLHVHVSRAGLSNLTIARAVTFVNDSANDAFMQALARRYETRYCSYREKDLDEAHIPGDRYEAVNLTGRHTIEFRMFRGSLKLEAVIAAAEFCHALLEFCARPELEAGALNARAFIRWCELEYPQETATLRAYVDERTAGLFRHAEAA